MFDMAASLSRSSAQAAVIRLKHQGADDRNRIACPTARVTDSLASRPGGACCSARKKLKTMLTVRRPKGSDETRDGKGKIMSDRAADFTGSIPSFYDQGHGPVFFIDFANDIARRVATSAPKRVLEIAAGTGIVTRRLRDLLPREAQLVATDLNPPMLEVARGKFRPDENIEFQPADATALPYPDASFDAVVCQFGVMFFPDKDKGHREGARQWGPIFLQRLGLAPAQPDGSLNHRDP
jgi:SAM-dependent methyltransferase